MVPYEVFDGVMLSDGSLYINPKLRNARFRMNLSGEEHLDWLYIIKENLELLSVRVSPQYPETSLKQSSFGGTYIEARLQSRCHPLLTEQYYRWYKQYDDNRMHKVVPLDLVLTSISLAHWFMGDGNSRKFKQTGYGEAVSVYFSTESYDIESILRLENMMHGFNLTTGRGYKKPKPKFGAGILISILQESINTFMDIVEPYALPSYRYKIKRRSKLPKARRRPEVRY